MNKKGLWMAPVITALALWFSLMLTAPLAQADGNVIQNPGFETQGTGGTDDAANWIEGTNHARANDKFNTGAWSLKSTFTGAGGVSTNQTGVPVTPNTAYIYSVYIWKAATNASSGSCVDMNDIAGETQLCATTTGSWQFLSGTWNSGTNTSITVRLITDGTPNAGSWFDDIALVSQTTASATLNAGNTPT